MSVPPVPTPEISASGAAPSGSCRRISGPSHSWFSSTFQSDSNCAGAKWPGLSPISLAASSASFTWKSPTSWTSAPNAREIAARSRLTPFGITTIIR